MQSTLSCCLHRRSCNDQHQRSCPNSSSFPRSHRPSCYKLGPVADRLGYWKRRPCLKNYVSCVYRLRLAKLQSSRHKLAGYIWYSLKDRWNLLVTVGSPLQTVRLIPGDQSSIPIGLNLKHVWNTYPSCPIGHVTCLVFTTINFFIYRLNFAFAVTQFPVFVIFEME